MARSENLLARYQRIIETSLDLVSTLNLREQLHKITHAAADLCNSEAASILLYDENKQMLYFQAASNIEEPLMSGIAVSMNSLAGWILTHKQAVIVGEEGQQHVSNDERHGGEVVQGFVTRSLLGVPLTIQLKSSRGMHEKVIGVLEVLNKTTGNFDQEDQELIMALGAQAAVAIENTRLFQQSDLIAEFVHEMRAPLAALSNAAYLLQRTGEMGNISAPIQNSNSSNELRSRAFNTMIAESTYLSNLAEDFLNLSRLESGRARFEAKVFDVVSLLEECRNLVDNSANEKNQSLTLIQLDKPLTLKADRQKIQQVIINLLTNAIKYTPEGGKIELGAQVKNIDEIDLFVSDTGTGIPENEVNQVFEKFYRVPGSEKIAAGTGLGLSICKEIVKAHRGRIVISNRAPEKGTRVDVYLPLPKTSD
ncbi:MAG: GAF domain-containing sensor histidine kinase [Chloroflexota bacterium]